MAATVAVVTLVATIVVAITAVAQTDFFKYRRFNNIVPLFCTINLM